MEAFKVDYSSTVNLPRTDFAMRANLPQNEPKMLDFWKSNDVYGELRRLKKGHRRFILHDGPPYSNGAIHLGQTLNKILKDIAIKYNTLEGADAPYIPGWDTHGLPNELATIKKHKLNPRTVDPVELREKCAEHALHYLDVQREQFVRLGVLGDWDHPYRTLDHSYEAAIAEMFGKMAEKGMIYRGLRPVHWCPKCETALAEAEIEYKDVVSDSIYVKFPFEDRKGLFPEWKGGRLFVLIWTTTPWTLPANVAIALNADAEYCVVRNGDEGYVMARGLVEVVREAAGLGEVEIVGSVKGGDLEGEAARHPFFDRKSDIVTAPYVILDDPESAGTGCVHTAPGHGRDDFDTGRRYNLDVLVPVDGRGRLTEEAGMFAGLPYSEANEVIIGHLRETGALLSAGKKPHSYPHCWRCHGPIIFRATKQWFVSVDSNDLRRKSLEAIDSIKWIPAWGHDRIYNMVEGRPDWCISRQRVWGVPIPAVFCDGCGEALYGPEVVGAAVRLFEAEGSDAWYRKSAAEILPEGFSCPKCHGTSFTKEKDIFDVWFESGVSHEAVMEKREELSWPADLYLEGGDQHRGWFQVSLLSSMAARGVPPFKAALTHGWVLDGKGNTMHKSLGNVIDPMDFIKKFGAEILRLFVSSVDYTADMRFSDEALAQIAEVYKKIRNSCRFLIGNLYDFSQDKALGHDQLLPEDRWILQRKNDLIARMRDAYSNYQFHVVYYYLQSFCASELSAVYMDVAKDRLYTCAPGSRERRSAQTAMYETLHDMVVAMSPVLSFTAEEIWGKFFAEREGLKSVFFADFPSPEGRILSDEEEKDWEFLSEIRSAAYLQLEELRKAKTIKQSLEAKVDVYAGGGDLERLERLADTLKSYLIVSQLRVHGLDEVPEGAAKAAGDVHVLASHADGEKCVRCWNYYTPDNDGGDNICKRCREAVSSL